ncbi:Regulatory protein CAT8 [Colletotrichum orbiculare MAFF 240422]|uniref:Regulatory protein CAT8 n=1 Tax=Colletotrichum orbiculare (strain 104-T / ATCC 96160 / CBS 514.97 / LARS 414 / MAFF 240422) TaxID=1213857 RepID=A0A484G0F8_COLOR|nr:Regulatory protein CAT8 [Colletotrichum orbiculare MAFF 240422]
MQNEVKHVAECRDRKVKCTAERPGCSNCRIRGHECRYAAGPSESYNASLKRRCQETERHNERIVESDLPIT